MKPYTLAMALAAAALPADEALGQYNPAAECNTPTCQPRHEYVTAKVAHQDILNGTRVEVSYNGESRVRHADGRQEKIPGQTMRGYVQTGYKITVLTSEYKRHADKPVMHVTLDPAYKTALTSERLCLSVPVKEWQAAPDGDHTQISFRLDENLSGYSSRVKFFEIVDKNNRDNEVWCYALKMR